MFKNNAIKSACVKRDNRKPVKSGLLDRSKEEQVEQYYDDIAADVLEALNEITYKYQELLGITIGDSWEELDETEPTRNIVAVLKDQLIHFMK